MNRNQREDLGSRWHVDWCSRNASAHFHSPEYLMMTKERRGRARQPCLTHSEATNSRRTISFTVTHEENKKLGIDSPRKQGNIYSDTIKYPWDQLKGTQKQRRTPCLWDGNTNTIKGSSVPQAVSYPVQYLYTHHQTANELVLRGTRKHSVVIHEKYKSFSK